MTTDPHAGAELTDDALQDEIELVGELVVAASDSEGPLSDEQIDAALGIKRSDANGQAGREGAAGAAGQGSGPAAVEGSGGVVGASHAGGHGVSYRQHV